MASEPATVVVDAGGLIAVERRSVFMTALVDEVEQTGGKLIVPAPVLAQAWRGGARQALLARMLNLVVVEVDMLSQASWQRAGELCGATRSSDVVDAAVVVCAHERGARAVVTSDPGDLRRLDPKLTYWTP